MNSYLTPLDYRWVAENGNENLAVFLSHFWYFAVQPINGGAFFYAPGLSHLLPTVWARLGGGYEKFKL